jgi:hypothetical protein
MWDKENKSFSNYRFLASGTAGIACAKAEKQSYLLEVNFEEKPYEEVFHLYDRMYKVTTAI